VSSVPRPCAGSSRSRAGDEPEDTGPARLASSGCREHARTCEPTSSMALCGTIARAARQHRSGYGWPGRRPELHAGKLLQQVTPGDRSVGVGDLSVEGRKLPVSSQRRSDRFIVHRHASRLRFLTGKWFLNFSFSLPNKSNATSAICLISSLINRHRNHHQYAVGTALSESVF
jgi:hypothetical protein